MNIPILCMPLPNTTIIIIITYNLITTFHHILTLKIQLIVVIIGIVGLYYSTLGITIYIKIHNISPSKI